MPPEDDTYYRLGIEFGEMVSQMSALIVREFDTLETGDFWDGFDDYFNGDT